jgi:hypothetical protein
MHTEPSTIPRRPSTTADDARVAREIIAIAMIPSA